MPLDHKTVLLAENDDRGRYFNQITLQCSNNLLNWHPRVFSTVFAFDKNAKKYTCFFYIFFQAKNNQNKTSKKERSIKWNFHWILVQKNM